MTIAKIRTIIRDAKGAQESLLVLSPEQRKQVLLSLSRSLERNTSLILRENNKDVHAASTHGLSSAFIDRLTLDGPKLSSIASSLREIAKLPELLFETLESRTMSSGIAIKKVRVPLGLLAVIYESRPNVTIDAFGMAFKSGNSILLKGGEEIRNTNHIFERLIRESLRKGKIDERIVYDLSMIARETSRELMENPRIDCLIPRGGKSLIETVRNLAKVPVIITGASVVHTFVDANADVALAVRVVANAKTRRVSICNALDVLLVHSAVARPFLERLSSKLLKEKVELRADPRSFVVLNDLQYPFLKKALKADFDTEFLDYILAVKIVDTPSEAFEHIKQHSLGHSECIITNNSRLAERFFREIDAACIYWNTSTQFSDGKEFGLGGEMGISTQKLHARGPFAYRELTTWKYQIESTGAVRP